MQETEAIRLSKRLETKPHVRQMYLKAKTKAKGKTACCKHPSLPPASALNFCEAVCDKVNREQQFNVCQLPALLSNKIV